MSNNSRYESFGVAEFISDRYFQQWVIHPDAASDAFWQQWMQEHPLQQQTIQQAKALLGNLRFADHTPAEAVVQRSLQEALQQISEPGTGRVVRMKRWKLAAAAVLLIGMAATAWWIGQTTHSPANGLVQGGDRKPEDVLPGSNRASLTLADGSVIVLNDAGNGVLSVQGDAQVQKKDSGSLVYTGARDNPQPVVYNTLTTPRGGQYQLTLADGTKVWLNAASSIRFPSRFEGAERIVELTGEGYFETSADSRHPFIVKTAGTTVQALGTRFDIMAYENEPLRRVTLTQGAVQVVHDEQKQLLAPGQQAVIPANGDPMRFIPQADVNLALAWKNGFILFNSSNLTSIMRETERWYDLDVSFEGAPPSRTFSGGVARTAPLSELLRIFESSNIRFRIEGHKMIVMP